jgi:hypothetical protein
MLRKVAALLIWLGVVLALLFPCLVAWTQFTTYRNEDDPAFYFPAILAVALPGALLLGIGLLLRWLSSKPAARDSSAS